MNRFRTLIATAAALIVACACATCASAATHSSPTRHSATHHSASALAHWLRIDLASLHLAQSPQPQVPHAPSHKVAPASVDVGVTKSTQPPSSTIARVLESPCQNTELMPEEGDLELIRAATFCLINQERARYDEQPLVTNGLLEQAAQGHSEAMVAEDYFAHIAPDGETPVDRVEATGYVPNSEVGFTLGENIAWGTLYLATPSSIVAAWIASPPHLANILTAEYRDTAIGVVPQVPSSFAEGQAGAIYTQEFGVIEG